MLDTKAREPIGPIAHEGATRRRVRVDPDAFDIDAIAAKPLDIDAPEIVVPYAPNDGGRLSKLRSPIDEDRRRAGRERTDEIELREPWVHRLARIAPARCRCVSGTKWHTTAAPWSLPLFTPSLAGLDAALSRIATSPPR
jgi:hypothetical protein